MITQFLKALWQLVVDYFATKDEVVPPVPVVVVEPVVVAPTMVEPLPNLATVVNFAHCIQSREGYIAPCKEYPKGTPAWRNKNPGNIKGTDGKFMVFSTYEEGFAYLVYYIKRVQANKHKAYPQNPTIKQYFSVYAPVEDANDPESYAYEVATNLGVTTSFLIKDLV